MDNERNETKREDELGALWVKENPKGEQYMTGSCICSHCGEKQDIIIFANNFRTKENHPAWRVLKSKPKEERTSTRRDEAQYQKPRLTKPVPQMTRLASLGVRDEDLPGFDSDNIPQTWASRPKPKPTKPVNGAKQADWTENVPPVEDDDIPGF